MMMTSKIYKSSQAARHYGISIVARIFDIHEDSPLITV